jgi:hypothetical protein
MPNVANYFFVSNNFTSLRIPAGDRHYFVVEVSGVHCGDTAFFARLCASLERREFLPALLAFFEARDVSAYAFDRPPMTAIKAEIVEGQKTTAVQFADDYEWEPEEEKRGIWASDFEEKCRQYFIERHVDLKFFPKQFGLAIRGHVISKRSTGGKAKYFPVEGHKTAKPYGEEFMDPPAESPAE